MLNIQSVCQEKNLDLLEQGPHGILGNDNVFIVRARKCAKKGWLG